jgi:hypothetical protein
MPFAPDLADWGFHECGNFLDGEADVEVQFGDAGAAGGVGFQFG